jgi:hypothetical protein
VIASGISKPHEPIWVACWVSICALLALPFGKLGTALNRRGLGSDKSILVRVRSALDLVMEGYGNAEGEPLVGSLALVQCVSNLWRHL